MKYGLILVEGSTEAEFVASLLNPHLEARGLHLTPKLATTKRASRGRASFTGGIVSFEKVEFDLRQLVKDRSVVIITTLIDFYGLAGKDFPGWETMPTASCYQQVEHVERAFGQRINEPRFTPYLALHEFEAMLFTKPAAFTSAFPGLAPQALERLTALKQEFASPETINLDQPPSKRIQALVPGYTKGLAASIILLECGLDAIRQECPHFNGWLTRLEAAANA